MLETVKAETDGTLIYAYARSFANRDLLGFVHGSKWRENDSRWELPLTWAAAKQLRSILGDNLELDDSLIEWGQAELHNRITPCMILRDLLSLDDRDVDKRLYPYQVAGAAFLVAAGQAILSDPPGAGKTATAITAARTLDALPAMVVAPKSTLVSWGREVEQWWPGSPVYVIDGPAEKRRELILQALDVPGWVILNWESVRRHSRLSPYGSMRLSEDERTPKELNRIPFRLVIADEAHRMKDPKSKQTRAVWSVGDLDSVLYRWALTGTPLTDQIDTLFPILRFIKKEEWPSKVAFVDRYALTKVVPWGSGTEVIGLNPANEEEFQAIFQPRFRRMPKEVILPQLPPIQRTRRFLDMHAGQRQAYDTMVEDLIAETDSGELLIAQNPAVKTLRMVQFSSACVDLRIVDSAATDPDDVDLGAFRARLIDPSNKLDALMDDLPDLLRADESVVVFAVSRQLIEMAEARLTKAKIPYAVIKGAQTMGERQDHIDAFQDGHVQIILVVIAAGGVGLTLTTGRIAIFLQRSWSFVENHQAEGRIHRIGSERHEAIQVIDYLSRGTIDEVVVEVAEGKAVKLEQIVRDREAIRRLLHGDLATTSGTD